MVDLHRDRGQPGARRGADQARPPATRPPARDAGNPAVCFPGVRGGPMLLVVRHAEAGDKSTWTGPDMLRPLSPSGHLQAEGLVVRLEDYPIEPILCSPTLRCRQTVQPLARDRMLEIEPVPALGVEASPAQLLELF